MKLTGIILTKNEEKNIADCLDCLHFCDEILVIDDYSTDRTSEIVEQEIKKSSKIKIFKRKLDNDFSKQREFGVEKSSNDWILFVDADERISTDLANEIKEALSSETDHGGYLIPRIDFMWGKQLMHGDSGKTKLLRLFDRKKGNLKGSVHEVWETKFLVDSLFYPIKHYPHQTISEFLREINFYTDIREKELFDKGVKTNLLLILFYTKGKFIQNYIFKLGFLDGMGGLIHALIMSFHSFLVRGKLYLLWQRKATS